MGIRRPGHKPVLTMNRPTTKELFNKIRDARQAVASERIEIVEADAVAADAIELEYDLETELKAILENFLDSISPQDYAGPRPPQKSYKDKIQGLDIFAFVLDSTYFKVAAYIKFAIAHETFWLVSLHKNRLNKEKP